MAKQASGGRSVELVIDLTNSSRYYDPAVFDARGASYVKIGEFLYISVFFLFSYWAISMTSCFVYSVRR
jgi:hypothetical protein